MNLGYFIYEENHNFKIYEPKLINKSVLRGIRVFNIFKSYVNQITVKSPLITLLFPIFLKE